MTTAPSSALSSTNLEEFLQIIVRHTSMAQFTLGKDKRITG
jgi:hypothetical protein